MDNLHQTNHETNVDGISVKTELEAEDSLAVLLTRIRLEGPLPETSVPALLEKQARAIVENVTSCTRAPDSMSTFVAATMASMVSASAREQ